MLSGKILNPLHVLLCIRESLVQKVLEKRFHGLRILGHPVFQGSLGGSLESQKVGRIHTEFQNPFYDGCVVIFSAEASGAVGQVHFLSQVPFRREFHEPGIARGLEGENPTLEFPVLFMEKKIVKAADDDVRIDGGMGIGDLLSCPEIVMRRGHEETAGPVKDEFDAYKASMIELRMTWMPMLIANR